MQVRESAILALGAVSEGCHMGLAPYLNDMVKMLVPVLQVGLGLLGGGVLPNTFASTVPQASIQACFGSSSGCASRIAPWRFEGSTLH